MQGAMSKVYMCLPKWCPQWDDSTRGFITPPPPPPRTHSAAGRNRSARLPAPRQSCPAPMNQRTMLGESDHKTSTTQKGVRLRATEAGLHKFSAPLACQLTGTGALALASPRQGRRVNSSGNKANQITVKTALSSGSTKSESEVPDSKDPSATNTSLP